MGLCMHVCPKIHSVHRELSYLEEDLQYVQAVRFSENFAVIL